MAIVGEGARRPASALRRASPLLAPLIVYLTGVALLGDWIIDDAGISYAYARNAAAGHGLVSQPDRPPVEGFSNFLWVVALTPFFALRLFDPVYTAKALGAAMVLGAFFLVQRALRAATSSRAPGLLGTLLAAASPPLVIWSASGLENGLTMLLLAALAATAVERPPRWLARCGALAALLAMTHPEGMIYAGFAGALTLGAIALGARPSRQMARDNVEFAAGFAALFGPFLAFRLAVFGLPLPHTYYAKRAYLTPWDRLTAIGRDPGALWDKFLGLGRGAGGPLGPLALGLTIGAAIYLAARRRLPRHAAVLLAMQLLAILGYLWIDDDWMGEHRFGTGAVFLSLLSFAAALFALARAVGVSAATPRARLACGALVAGAWACFFPRIFSFAQRPPTPFAEIDRSYTKTLDAYADRLGVVKGSVLLPDVGAMLYGSRLTVHDAAGLCEPAVIHTLKRDTHVWLSHHPAFYDLVFEELRPTFISTHHFWTYVAAFEDDPRFLRDYVAISSYEDAYVRGVYRRSLRSGTYVRRDAIADPRALRRLLSEGAPPPPPDPFAVRLERRARALVGLTPRAGAAP